VDATSEDGESAEPVARTSFWKTIAKVNVQLTLVVVDIFVLWSATAALASAGEISVDGLVDVARFVFGVCTAVLTVKVTLVLSEAFSHVLGRKERVYESLLQQEKVLMKLQEIRAKRKKITQELTEDKPGDES